MPQDMLERLALDPGSRTLGELIQEREWAVGEIRRLRFEANRLSQQKRSLQIEREAPPLNGAQKEGLDPALHTQRLLRLGEVATMIGMGRSTIYKYVDEGRFPAPVRIGDRTVRWKLADVLAWRTSVSDSDSDDRA